MPEAKCCEVFWDSAGSTRSHSARVTHGGSHLPDATMKNTSDLLKCKFGLPALKYSETSSDYLVRSPAGRYGPDELD